MDDVINYVTNTPANSNPNVLRDMLKSSGGNGNISEFFTKEKVTATIDSNTYENTAMFETCGTFNCDFPLDSFPTWFKWEPGQTIIITVDNNSFEIPITTDSDTIIYGATPLEDRSGFDFSEYDYCFNLFYDPQESKTLSCFVASKEIKESYSLTFEVSGEIITFSNQFQSAIEDVIARNEGPGDVKFTPIYLTSNSGETIDLTDDQMQEFDNAISSISFGCIPYLDVSFTGGMVPSHSLFFYGHKETNPRILTFVGGTRIALYTGRKIFFTPMEQPKVSYSTTSNNISWNRNGADVLVKCETERSNFTDRYVDMPLYVKPDNFSLRIYAPIFNLTQNKMAGYVKVGSSVLELFWFDGGAANTDIIAFSTNYRTGDSWDPNLLYPDGAATGQ